MSQFTKEYATTAELSEMFGFSPAFWEKKRHLGGGPKYIKIDGGHVRYSIAEVRAWLEARQCESTSQSKPRNRKKTIVEGN